LNWKVPWQIAYMIKSCFAFRKHSCKFHVNMSPLMCGSRGRRLVINLSYHTYISFIFIPFPYNTTHLVGLATFYNCPSFMMLMWSYHWWSGYPFISMPMWEWTYYRTQYTLRYSCNSWFGEWNTYSKGGLPPFPLLHLTMNGYHYHQGWLLNLDGCHHYWPNLHKYGATNINDNRTCSNDDYLRKNTIIHWTST
jgi:hypothetical protein